MLGMYYPGMVGRHHAGYVLPGYVGRYTTLGIYIPLPYTPWVYHPTPTVMTVLVSGACSVAGCTVTRPWAQP